MKKFDSEVKPSQPRYDDFLFADLSAFSIEVSCYFQSGLYKDRHIREHKCVGPILDHGPVRISRIRPASHGVVQKDINLLKSAAISGSRSRLSGRDGKSAFP